MRNQCILLILLFSFGLLTLTTAQEFSYETKSPFTLGLEYYAKLGLFEDTTCSTSAITTLEISNRIKQFETDFNAAANSAVLADHFCSGAIMLDFDNKKNHGAYAIGIGLARFFETTPCKLNLELDEVLELSGGYALVLSRYVSKMTLKGDSAITESKGNMVSLYRFDAGLWKILHLSITSNPE